MMTLGTRLSTALKLAALALTFAALGAPSSATAGRLDAAGRAAATAAGAKVAGAPKVAGGVVDVVEFFHAGLKHYFISADPAEIAVLDSGAFGGVWKRTGASFPAWDVNGAPAGTVPVCRFFGTDRYRADGSRIGPNSHFYTADPAECAFVKTAYKSVAQDGIAYPAWTFEANAFAVRLPVGGACPAGTQPLYRTYNDGANGDPNHRYSTSAATLQGMTGWTFEGLVMCLPAATGTALPPQMTACGQNDCPVATATLGNGVGLVNVIVDLANASGTSLTVVIPAGQTFVSTSGTFQDGLAVERLSATIPAGGSARFLVQLFCMQASRHASAAGASYTPGPQTANAQLQDIITLTDGKLGSVGDPLGLKAEAVQFAVWEVTDGRGALTAQQRSLLSTLLATPATDLLAMSTLAEEFLGTLSITP